ncbi:hypothetical protein ACVI7B_008944, partial [Bradyrhizobium elkanii]
ARMMGRLYAAARLYVNFFQPSFKLKEKRREGAIFGAASQSRSTVIAVRHGIGRQLRVGFVRWPTGRAVSEWLEIE